MDAGLPGPLRRMIAMKLTLAPRRSSRCASSRAIIDAGREIAFRDLRSESPRSTLARSSRCQQRIFIISLFLR